MHSIIEKIDESIYLSMLNIPGFIAKQMQDEIPADYSRGQGIDLCSTSAGLYCTDEEIERVAKSRSLKRQVEWLCGRVALKELIMYALFRDLGYREILIRYDQNSKPFLHGHREIGISVSHSGDIAMAALHTVPGKRIGVDVDRAQGVDTDAVMKVAFSQGERDIYRGTSADEIITVFTLKEAYLKIMGSGFHEVLSKVTVHGKNILFNAVEVESIETVTRKFHGGYIASIIYEK